MIYKFSSKASGDVLMLSSVGDHLLRLIGRSPGSKGIIEARTLEEAIVALENAVSSLKARPDADQQTGEGENPDEDEDEAVDLRQRAWPLIEMMKRAKSENADITWGV